MNILGAQAMVKPIRLFDDGALRRIEHALSTDRIGTYVAASGGDLRAAMALHTWNTGVSAAFYGPLQALEVGMRSAMHRELSATFGGAWYDNLGDGAGRCDLAAYAMNRVEEAKDALAERGKPVTPPQVVATLMFGFWVSLLGRGGRGLPARGSRPADERKRDYEMRLWRPALHKAFSNARLPRQKVHEKLRFLRDFRNGIAHHEPVFHRDLGADHASILAAAGWISSDLKTWIAHHSRVERVLRLRHPLKLDRWRR